METPVNALTHSSVISENGYKCLWVPMLVSLIGHLLLFVGMYFVPSFQSSDMSRFSAISVDLVSMPGSYKPGGSGPTKPKEINKPPAPEKKPKKEGKSAKKIEPVKEVSPKPEKIAPVIKEVVKEPVEPKKSVSLPPEVAKPEPSAEPEPEVSLAPKEQKPKLSLKKKTFNPSEVVKKAIDQFEKETARGRSESDSGSGTESGAESIQDAINKMRKDVAETQPQPGVSSSGSGSPGQGGAGGFGNSGIASGGSGIASGQMAVYNGEIIHQIQQNWAFSDQLAKGSGNIEVLIGIKIKSTGEIQDIWFDKRSGNQYLDESALRAIKKANPLPPTPKDYMEPFYIVGLRFTPEGLIPSR